MKDLRFILLSIWMDQEEFTTRSLRKMAFWAILAAIAGAITLIVLVATGNSGFMLLWALWPFAAILAIWALAIFVAVIVIAILSFWNTVVGVK